MGAAGKLAIIAAAGAVAYVAWRRGIPTAASSLEAIAGYAPPAFVADRDHELANIGLRAWAGEIAGDPVLQQVPDPTLARQVADLVARGCASLAHGIRTTGCTTAQDRAILAEAECRRAAAVGLMPVWLVDDCARTLASSSSFAYQPPGQRITARIDIGRDGLPGYSRTGTDRVRPPPGEVIL